MRWNVQKIDIDLFHQLEMAIKLSWISSTNVDKCEIRFCGRSDRLDIEDEISRNSNFKICKVCKIPKTKQLFLFKTAGRSPSLFLFFRQCSKVRGKLCRLDIECACVNRHNTTLICNSEGRCGAPNHTKQNPRRTIQSQLVSCVTFACLSLLKNVTHNLSGYCEVR